MENHQSIIEINQEVFDKKDFKVFYTDIYGKLAPLPGGHVFGRIVKAGTILVEGHQSNIPANLH